MTALNLSGQTRAFVKSLQLTRIFFKLFIYIYFPEQICDYEDKKDTATFDNYKGANCRNSGENMKWSLNKDESVLSSKEMVLTFVSSHWDPPKNLNHSGVKFQVS